MNRERYGIHTRMITVICIFTIIMNILIGYYITGSNAIIVVNAFTCACFMITLIYLHRIDDMYISQIVDDMSKLTDVLNELEEKEIFPSNEDTLVSKLQNKVIKLARILKKKNELSNQEHEDIKALVSDISHQLKTPIANLKMYTNFLEDSSLSDEKRKEYIDIINLSVERLNFLSESMIKISRLESGLIHLDMHEQSLNETVLKSVKDVYVKAKNKGVTINYEEEDDIDIVHDGNWTSEAIFNLLDNAVKYAKNGDEINLSLKRTGMFADVSIRDTNGPISEEERAKIFTRFYRGANSHDCEGIGIGLYLSREIAVKQGGYLNLKTTKEGNIFSFILYAQNKEKN